MGCWNHTCAITNLPIWSGEEVEVILLKSNNEYDSSSFCHSDAYHTPLPLTFSGKYNDYGGVEDCKGVALETIVETLRENLFEMEEGENKYHDIPVRKDEFNIDKLFVLDHEERLFIKNFQMVPDMRERIRIKHIVVRKEVYDGLIAKMKFERWNRETFETYKIGYKKLAADCKRLAGDMDGIIALDSGDYKRHSWMMDGLIGDTIVGHMLSYRGIGMYGMDYPIRVSKVLFDMRAAGDERFEAMVDNALRLSMMVSFMEGARKSWHVPSGVGSQDESTSYQRLCAKFTLSSAKIVDKIFEEDE